jgi:outer membrane lipoprotein-sorting protein
MRTAIAAILAVAVLFVPGRPVEAEDEAEDEVTAREVLDHVDDLFRGSSSFGTFSMQVVTEHYRREMKMEGWSRGKDHSLVRILAPRKEKGMATLKAGRDIWNYLPKVDRVIKVPSSMMGGSWMGSHFTNDDLVKESRMANDYTYEITFRGDRDGREVIDLTLTPLPEAAVVWGKVTVTVLKEGWIPLSLGYYDEDMDLARTMTYSDVRNLGGRRIPAKIEMRPADKPGEHTEIVYHDIEFDIELSDDLFTLRSLTQ